MEREVKHKKRDLANYLSPLASQLLLFFFHIQDQEVRSLRMRLSVFFVPERTPTCQMCKVSLDLIVSAPTLWRSYFHPDVSRRLRTGVACW